MILAVLNNVNYNIEIEIDIIISTLFLVVKI